MNANMELSIDGAVISPPTQEALDLKAVKTYVDDKIANLVNNAPAALDTLREFAQALGNDNFSASIKNSLATKAPLNTPTLTGAVLGISQEMVNLANVGDTSDLTKPILKAHKII